MNSEGGIFKPVLAKGLILKKLLKNIPDRLQSQFYGHEKK